MPKLVLDIAVNDKGNLAVVGLDKNIKKLKQQTVPLKEIFKGTFAAGAVLKGIRMLGTGLRVAANEAAQFELSMKKIQAITKKSNEEVARFEDVARKLALGTEHSAKQIADAMLEISKMGFDPDETIKALPAILDLSTAAMSDLTWSAKNSINILKAFNLESTEMERVSNVVAVALNKTSLNFEEYMEGLKFVSPIASKLNISFEETTAILGKLADVGLRGSIAGTTLKNMMLNLLKTTPATAKALKGMNMEGADLTDILDQLNKKGVPVVDILKQFNKRGIVGALAIGETAEATKTLREQLEAGEITAKEMADTMRTSLILSSQNLKNAFNEITLSFMDAFGPNIQKIITDSAELLKEFAEVIQDNEEELSKLAEVMVSALSNLSKFGGTVVLKAVENWRALLAVFIAFKWNAWSVAIVEFAAKFKIAAFSMQASVPVLLAVALAFAGIFKALESIDAQLDKWNEKVSKGFNNPQSVKQLENIRDALEAISMTKLDLEQPVYGETARLLEEQLKRQEKQKEKALKIFQDTHGVVAREQAENIEWVYSMLKGIEAIDAKAKAAKESIKKIIPEVKPKFGDVVGGSDDAGASAEKKLWASIKEDARIAKNMLWDEQKERDLLWASIEEDAKQAKRLLWDDYNETRRVADEKKEILQGSLDFMQTAHSGTMDLINAMNDARFAKEMEQFDKKEERIKKLYAAELSQVQGSAFKKAMAEEKYNQKMAALEEERERKNKEMQKKQAAWKIAIATADAFVASIGAIAGTDGGALSRLAAGAVVLGSALGLAATVTSTLSGARAGEYITGNGNGTSDNLARRVSPGERILSVDETNRLGGNSGIRRMLDRSTSYNNSSSTTVYVDTIIGTEEYVRSTVIPIIEKEKTR